MVKASISKNLYLGRIDWTLKDIFPIWDTVPGPSLFQILSGDHYGSSQSRAGTHVDLYETGGTFCAPSTFNAKWVLSKQKKKQQPSRFLSVSL